MKAVSVALFSLAGSALAMPPSQGLERRVAVTDDQWSSLWEQGCSKAVTKAREDCKSGESNTDCDEIGRKAGTECLVDKSKPEATDQSRHDECKTGAIQGVEDCINGKNNTKTVPQCQRGQVEAYLTCTYTGPGKPTTEQDTEFSKIWADNCLQPSLKANEECRNTQDFGGKCEHARNDNDMKCLLDNSKARAKSEFVHNACLSAATAGTNDCFYTNNKGKTLTQCQREQWDAYPACVDKHAPQNTETKAEEAKCT